MKVTRLRAGVLGTAFAVLIALALFAIPANTNAAPGHETSSQVTNANHEDCTIKVRPGEALYLIAARYDTTTAYLASLNNLYNPNYIYAGMILRVPCGPEPKPQPYPEPKPKPDGRVCDYYIVQRGDWLNSIAVRFGISWPELAKANGLYNPNYIYAGQRLAIPCGHTPPKPPVCPGCPPCEGCPPVNPTPPPPPPPPPVCPGCPPCEGCPPVNPTPPPPLLNIVTIGDDSFAPPLITVRHNQYVQWINRGQKPHTVTQGLCPGGVCTPTPGGFNSGPLEPGGTYAFQFTQIGTFVYFDQYTGVGATVAVVP